LENSAHLGFRLGAAQSYQVPGRTLLVEGRHQINHETLGVACHSHVDAQLWLILMDGEATIRTFHAAASWTSNE
jgi:hypothetical protein